MKLKQVITESKKLVSCVMIFLCLNVSFLFADHCPNQQLTFENERDGMIKTIKGYFSRDSRRFSPKVEAAFRLVPRHEFVRCEDTNSAYQDSPLPIGSGQTISQPYIVALMTEILDINDNDNVLEIGTGSGYQAAILSQLVTKGHVHTIEIIEALGNSAKKKLEGLAYANLSVYVQDGYHGLKSKAPFDKIIVTAAASHLPPALLEQLKVGGKMVIPVGRPGLTQVLKLITKEGNEKYNIDDVLSVRFVPFTGVISTVE